MRVSHSWGPVVKVICLIIALALMLAVPALAGKVINTVKVTDFSDRVEISVNATETPTFNPRVPTDGSYICFAFPGKAAFAGKYTSIKSGHIYGVRYGNFTSNPPVTRVVVNTKSHLNYSTTWSDDKRTVVISVWKHGVLPDSAGTVAPALHQTAEKPKPVTAVNTVPVKAKEITRLPAPTPFVTRVVEQKGSDSGIVVEPVKGTSQNSAPPVVNEPVSVAKAVSTSNGVRNISLDFIAADINDVLKALSVQSGSNIVCGSDVKGSVTVSLNKVSLEEALDYVAKLSGYRYARDGDTFIVGSAKGVGSIVDIGAGDNGSDTTSDAIGVRFCDPKGLEEVLSKQFPDLKVSANATGDEKDKGTKPGVRVLAFVGPPALVAQARQFVEKLEAAFQKEVHSQSIEVYEVKYADPKELVSTLNEVIPQVAVTLAASDGFNMKAPGPVAIDSNQGATVQQNQGAAVSDKDKVYQRLIVAGEKEDVKRAIDLLARTDVKLPQILIEAKVTDIGLSAEKRLGVKWTWSEVVGLEGYKVDPLPKDPSTEDQSGSGKFFRMPVGVSATLDAMFKDGTAKLLANPHITTIEGKPAVFFVGDEIKYIINITTSLTGTTVATDTAKVGIQLRVAADVSPDREITLSLHPEVSVINEFIRVTSAGGTDTIGSGIVLPQIARRFTDQVIRVKDGESIVIGGLIKEKELNNMTKVPLLGDLPFFGSLFRHREKTREKSEIVIFIKASIVE